MSEREMVAFRIRATVGDLSANNAFPHLWRAVTGETAPEMDREARGELFLMLADLIDPTCRNLSDPDLLDFKCSECGLWYEEPVPMFRYCPNCGARVVSD